MSESKSVFWMKAGIAATAVVGGVVISNIVGAVVRWRKKGA